jgi:hypothetical protein
MVLSTAVYHLYPYTATLYAPGDEAPCSPAIARAAASSMSSLMRVAPLAIHPSPSPGNTKQLLAWAGRRNLLPPLLLLDAPLPRRRELLLLLPVLLLLLLPAALAAAVVVWLLLPGLYCRAGKGLPEAKAARPELQVTACSKVSSDLSVGFESANRMGRA